MLICAPPPTQISKNRGWRLDGPNFQLMLRRFDCELCSLAHLYL